MIFLIFRPRQISAKNKRHVFFFAVMLIFSIGLWIGGALATSGDNAQVTVYGAAIVCSIYAIVLGCAMLYNHCYPPDPARMEAERRRRAQWGSGPHGMAASNVHVNPSQHPVYQ
jgi:hypothetical protein